MHSVELRILAYFLPLYYNNVDISDFSFKLKIQNILNHLSFHSWFRASVAVVFRHFTAAEFCQIVLYGCHFFLLRVNGTKVNDVKTILVSDALKLKTKYFWVCCWGPIFLFNRSKDHGSGCTKTFSGMQTLSLPRVLSNTTHLPVQWRYIKPAQINDGTDTKSVPSSKT